MSGTPAYIKVLDDGNIRASGPKHTISWALLAQFIKDNDHLLGPDDHVVQLAMTQEGVTYYIETRSSN